MTLLNLDIVLEQIRQYGQGAADAVPAGLFQEGEAIMAESKRIVPVDTGTLRSTGHVVPPRSEGSRIVVELAYGGPAAPYAIVQHENLEYRHNPPQQAKYLEQPVNQRIPQIPRNLARFVERRARAAAGI